MAVPVWLTPAEHRTVAAVARPARSPPTGQPGRRRGRRGRLRRPAARCVHVRPAPHLGRRPFSRPPRRRRRASTGGSSSARSRSWRGASASRARRADPSASSTARSSAGRSSYRTALAALGDDFADLDPDAPRPTASPRPTTSSASSPSPTPASRSTAIRSTAATATGAGWQAIGFAGDVQPRGWTDAEVERPVSTAADPALDCDAVIVGSGPAGVDGRRRADRGGLVGDRAREGPQPPARRSTRRSGRSATSPTTS